MKNLGVTCVIACMLLISCGEEEKTESVTTDSVEIISDYADTLEGSIGDARSAVDTINKRTQSTGE